MNKIILMGRLTKDAEIRYTPNQTAYARFSIAINRGKNEKGEDMGADYPTIVCWGKTAELVEKYTQKGMMIAVEGKIRTGSYEKDGKKIYTTEVQADRVEFMEKKAEKKEEKKEEPDDLPAGFSRLTYDDILF